MSFAQRLTEVRKTLGVSQGEFAKKIGLSSYRTIQQYEAGSTLPNAEALGKLYDLGFNINWLVSGKGGLNFSSELSAELKVLIRDAIIQVSESESERGTTLRAEDRADIVVDLVSDALSEGDREVNSSNVIRFVKYAGAKN